MKTQPDQAEEEHAPSAPAERDVGEWEAPGRGAGLRDGLLYCVKVFLAVRVALFVVALLAVALLPELRNYLDATKAGLPHPVDVPGWPAHGAVGGWHNLFTAWEREDALWYLRIATKGYAPGDGSAAFFPLYPLAIRAVSFLIGNHPFAASLLVSNGAFLGALMMLYVLGRTEISEPAARRAVVYAAIFPTAFFFFAPYTESLFLLLALGAFWGARRRKWWVAGLCGAGAALTRNLGVLLVLPLAAEAVHQAWDRRPRRVPVEELVWSVVPVIGTLAYLSYWQVKTGDRLAPLHQQANWSRKLTNPLATLWDGTRVAWRFLGSYAAGYHQIDWLVTAVVLVAATYATAKLRPSYGVYLWAGILAPLSYVWLPRPLMSFPRFALPLFPIYWGMALWTERGHGRHEVVVAGSALFLGLLTLLFVNWYYIF